MCALNPSPVWNPTDSNSPEGKNHATFVLECGCMYIYHVTINPRYITVHEQIPKLQLHVSEHQRLVEGVAGCGGCDGGVNKGQSADHHLLPTW